MPSQSIYQKLRGTLESLFQIGSGGPQLKNNAGVLEARNAGDTAYAIMRGGTPVGANDLVPLAATTPVYTGSPAVLQTGAKTWIATVTTNAAGAVTVAIPAGLFSSILMIDLTVINPGTTVFRSATPLSFTTTSISVQVFESRGAALGASTMQVATSACTVQVAVQGLT